MVEEQDMEQCSGVPASPSGCQPTASAAEEASSQSGIPNAMRLKLDRRIHNQRVALRENWMIVDLRQSGHRRFTEEAIRRLSRLCNLLEIPKRTPDGGTYTLLYRAKLAASAIEARRAATEDTGAVHESATRQGDAQ